MGGITNTLKNTIGGILGKNMNDSTKQSAATYATADSGILENTATSTPTVATGQAGQAASDVVTGTSDSIGNDFIGAVPVTSTTPEVLSVVKKKQKGTGVSSLLGF